MWAHDAALPRLSVPVDHAFHEGDALPGGTTVVAMIFVSFACYGVVSQALFSFGAELAAERQKGWLRRLRWAARTSRTG